MKVMKNSVDGKIEKSSGSVRGFDFRSLCSSLRLDYNPYSSSGFRIVDRIEVLGDVAKGIVNQKKSGNFLNRSVRLLIITSLTLSKSILASGRT